MALETGVTYIEDLDATNPVGSTDFVDEGDNHIRNIKTGIQGSFPSLGAAAVVRTAAEINTALFKIIEIGDWDMDSTNSVDIAHGLTYSKIRTVMVTVRDDADTQLHHDTRATGINGITTFSAIIRIERSAGGPFDSALYDATSYNRGWITIQYTD